MVAEDAFKAPADAPFDGDAALARLHAALGRFDVAELERVPRARAERADFRPVNPPPARVAGIRNLMHAVDHGVRNEMHLAFYDKTEVADDAIAREFLLHVRFMYPVARVPLHANFFGGGDAIYDRSEFVFHARKEELDGEDEDGVPMKFLLFRRVVSDLFVWYVDAGRPWNHADGEARA